MAVKAASDVASGLSNRFRPWRRRRQWLLLIAPSSTVSSNAVDSFVIPTPSSIDARSGVLGSCPEQAGLRNLRIPFRPVIAIDLVLVDMESVRIV